MGPGAHRLAEVWVEAIRQLGDTGGDLVKVHGLLAPIPLYDKLQACRRGQGGERGSGRRSVAHFNLNTTPATHHGGLVTAAYHTFTAADAMHKCTDGEGAAPRRVFNANF